MLKKILFTFFFIVINSCSKKEKLHNLKLENEASILLLSSNSTLSSLIVSLSLNIPVHLAISILFSCSVSSMFPNESIVPFKSKNSFT